MSFLASLSAGFVALFAAPMALATQFRAPGRSARANPARGAVPEAGRLTAVEQWDRVTSVLGQAIGSATNAKDLQAGAALQLDLATYALHSLLDDISRVMLEPIARDAAVVLRLPVERRDNRVRALAA